MSTDRNAHSVQTNEPSQPNVQSAERRYRLSPEEYRALQECNRESFFFRSLPLATTTMIAVHLATKRGLLSSHPKWGSTWKVLGAGFVSWFVGKVSYQRKCAEKLMQLPNSHLGETLRRRSGGYVQETLETEHYSAPLDISEPVAAPLSSEPGARDLFPQKDVSPTGLEDRLRPSVDNPQLLEQATEEPPPQVHTTYDELRRKNRESVPSSSGPNYPVYRSPSSPSPPPGLHKERPGGSKNLYGDVWDD